MSKAHMLGSATATREPLQGRSRASFQRMLLAARKLLIDRGSDDFTLLEVSKVGKVSIGSIYCRFDSKDALIHAVQASVQLEILTEQLAMVTRVGALGRSLAETVALLVDAIAESFRHHAPILRPIMLRASVDPIVANGGKQAFHTVAAKVAAAFLMHRDEISHPDPDRAAEACFRIVYAALARYLGFGMLPLASREGDWQHLKNDLALMGAAFLMARPRPGQRHVAAVAPAAATKCGAAQRG